MRAGRISGDEKRDGSISPGPKKYVDHDRMNAVVIEKAGTIVAVRAPADVDLSAVRERYGV